MGRPSFWFLVLALLLIRPATPTLAADPPDNGRNAEQAESDNGTEGTNVKPDHDADVDDASSTDSTDNTPEKPRLGDLDEYYELQQLLVDALDRVEACYVKEPDRRKLVEAAIRGMLSELDPYSAYVGPDDIARFDRAITNKFGGIGVRIAIEERRLVVLTPMLDSPAFEAGIRAGDAIHEVDGKELEGLAIDDVMQLMQGEVGTELTVTFTHPDDPKRHTATLERRILELETVIGYSRTSDGCWRYMIDPDRKIGYIRIATFGQHTAQHLRRVLVQLKNEAVQGLVIDLRFNPGGLLSSAIEICDLFLDDGRIVSVEGRVTDHREWNASSRSTICLDTPVMLLVNRFSASASEVTSACLQDNGRAIIVGQRTWGKGSVQNVLEMEGGASVLKLTTAGYIRPSGENIHRYPDSSNDDVWGVMPDKLFEFKFSDQRQSQLLDQLELRGRIPRNDDEAMTVDLTFKADPYMKRAYEHLVRRTVAETVEEAVEGTSEKQKPAPVRKRRVGLRNKS